MGSNPLRLSASAGGSASCTGSRSSVAAHGIGSKRQGRCMSSPGLTTGVSVDGDWARRRAGLAIGPIPARAACGATSGRPCPGAGRAGHASTKASTTRSAIDTGSTPDGNGWVPGSGRHPTARCGVPARCTRRSWDRGCWTGEKEFSPKPSDHRRCQPGFSRTCNPATTAVSWSEGRVNIPTSPDGQSNAFRSLRLVASPCSLPSHHDRRRRSRRRGVNTKSPPSGTSRRRTQRPCLASPSKPRRKSTGATARHTRRPAVSISRGGGRLGTWLRSTLDRRHGGRPDACRPAMRSPRPSRTRAAVETDG